MHSLAIPIGEADQFSDQQRKTARRRRRAQRGIRCPPGAPGGALLLPLPLLPALPPAPPSRRLPRMRRADRPLGPVGDSPDAATPPQPQPQLQPGRKGAKVEPSPASSVCSRCNLATAGPATQCHAALRCRGMGASYPSGWRWGKIVFALIASVRV